LWLDGRERKYVEECGVMNVFFVMGEEVITPSLEGTILPGITRESVITLLRDYGVTVRERRVSIDEVLTAFDRGSLVECFGTGTAATVSHVRRLRYGDREIELPPVKERTVGPAVRERLVALATGQAPDPHGWLDVIGTGGK
jgi:branched-chain amino acid aminotransferase